MGSIYHPLVLFIIFLPCPFQWATWTDVGQGEFTVFFMLPGSFLSHLRYKLLSTRAVSVPITLESCTPSTEPRRQ